MAKAEIDEKAWRHRFKGDFSTVDRIFHQTKFKAFDQGPNTGRSITPRRENLH